MSPHAYQQGGNVTAGREKHERCTGEQEPCQRSKRAQAGIEERLGDDAHRPQAIRELRTDSTIDLVQLGANLLDRYPWHQPANEVEIRK